MFFYYMQDKEEIKINLKVCNDSVNYLKEEGYLDDDFNISEYIELSENDYDVYDLEILLRDAIIDYLEDKITIREEIDRDEEYIKEYNDVIRAIMVMDENLFFNQFLRWSYV